jgi:class 3 adenylate cyclase
MLIAGRLFAQNDRLKELENEAIGAYGIQRLEKGTLYIDALIANGNYEAAEEWAEDMEQVARKLRLPRWRAIALNRQGKAMVLAGKRKATARLLKSNEILEEEGQPDRNILLENMALLRQLALHNGKIEEVAEIDARIEHYKSSVPSSPTPPPPPPDKLLTHKEFREEMTAIQTKLLSVGRMTEEEKQHFIEETQNLQEKLVAKEAEISRMTEAQMKSSIMVMQQRYLLDSLSFQAGMDSLAISNNDLALREAKSSRRFYLVALAALVLMCAAALFSVFKARQYAHSLEVKNNMIVLEQERSENLLLNILPALIAEELKTKGRTTARLFDNVSVLFADFVNFSSIAEQRSPAQLVSDLDVCFQAFDEMVARNGLEKIKTIGDAYMCAGGIPNGDGSHIKDMIHTALEMQQWLYKWNMERDTLQLPRYDARIGIHCGPVVAGVVGSHKFAFDIWGDTVNVAARIEQAGESGRVNISGDAYRAIKDRYACQYRGKIAVKNKGEIDMYFVET